MKKIGFLVAKQGHSNICLYKRKFLTREKSSIQDIVFIIFCSKIVYDKVIKYKPTFLSNWSIASLLLTSLHIKLHVDLIVGISVKSRK